MCKPSGPCGCLSDPGTDSKFESRAGHYNRALEEAIQTHKSQWAKDWESKNPLSGGQTFTTMSPTERVRPSFPFDPSRIWSDLQCANTSYQLTLLRTLILWSLSSSDVIRGIIATSYKQSRHEDDLNQPLSVQPWGSDADKRRYYLIEGLDDTHFRIYRESNHTSIKRTWWGVAGDIDELKALAEKLNTEDGGQKARTLSTKILTAIPRFEATEEVCPGRLSPLILITDPTFRNESAVNTDRSVSSNSSARSQTTLCTKVAHEASG